MWAFVALSVIYECVSALMGYAPVVSPVQEGLQIHGQLGLIARPMPHLVLDVAVQPSLTLLEVGSIHLICDSIERASPQPRADEVDLHPPAGVVARCYLDPGGMLPLAVARLGVPSLQVPLE